MIRRPRLACAVVAARSGRHAGQYDSFDETYCGGVQSRPQCRHFGATGLYRLSFAMVLVPLKLDHTVNIPNVNNQMRQTWREANLKGDAKLRNLDFHKKQVDGQELSLNLKPKKRGDGIDVGGIPHGRRSVRVFSVQRTTR
jgi:hypothetical protein